MYFIVLMLLQIRLSSFFFSDSFLLQTATDLYVLILYPITLMKLFKRSNNITCLSLSFAVPQIHTAGVWKALAHYPLVPNTCVYE